MKLRDNIDLIDGSMANCYVVVISGKTILIDSGMRSSGRKIIEYFDRNESKPDIVLITHSHVDHIGGLRDIESKYRPQIFAPDNEINIVKGLEKMPQTGGFLSKLTGFSKADSVETVMSINALRLDGMRVVDTKGHTPGSTSFYFEELKALFVGDAIMEKKGRFEYNKSFTLDPRNADESMKEILSFHGVTAYPGHGNPFLIP